MKHREFDEYGCREENVGRLRASSGEEIYTGYRTKNKVVAAKMDLDREATPFKD